MLRRLSHTMSSMILPQAAPLIDQLYIEVRMRSQLRLQYAFEVERILFVHQLFSFLANVSLNLQAAFGLVGEDDLAQLEEEFVDLGVPTKHLGCAFEVSGRLVNIKPEQEVFEGWQANCQNLGAVNFNRNPILLLPL